MSHFSNVLFAVASFALAIPALSAQESPTGQAAQSTPKAANPAAGSPHPATDLEEHWQTVLIGDERIGYVRSRLEPADKQGRVRTDTETKMTFKRFGQEISIGVTIATTETTDGQLLGYEYEMKSVAGSTKSVGVVKGETLEITSTIAEATSTRTIPFDTSVKSPAYQDRLLREKGLEPGQSHTFSAFLPEMNEVTEVTITADEKVDVTLPNGTTPKLLKMTIEQSVLPNLPMTAYRNDSGEIVLAEMALLGQRMRLVEVSKAEALSEVAASELDLAVSSLIPATALDNPHATQKVIYRIHVPGENAAALFVDGGTQHVKPIDRETVEVTVTSRAIPKRAGPGKARAEFTEPSLMLQSDDSAITEMLAKATEDGQSPSEAAIALEAYVHTIISEKNFTNAFASAKEVAESLEGDCSEHAVLLAALLRARGIPSRLVAGLVYVPNQAKMGGHMWTEALLGDKWIPLDATLGRGGIGSGHIKIGVTSLSNEAPLPVTCFEPLLSLGSETTIEVLDAER